MKIFYGIGKKWPKTKKELSLHPLTVFFVLNTQPNMLWNWRGPGGGGGAQPLEWQPLVNLKNISRLSNHMILIKFV